MRDQLQLSQLDPIWTMIVCWTFMGSSCKNCHKTSLQSWVNQAEPPLDLNNFKAPNNLTNRPWCWLSLCFFTPMERRIINKKNRDSTQILGAPRRIGCCSCGTPWFRCAASCPRRRGHRLGEVDLVTRRGRTSRARIRSSEEPGINHNSLNAIRSEHWLCWTVMCS